MRKNFIFISFMIGVTVLLFTDTNAETAIDGELLNAQTVKIKVEHQEGAEVGSGVVLCQKDDQVYVLTAKHVLFGEGSFDIYEKPTKRFRGGSSIMVTIEFYKDIQPPIKSYRQSFRIKHASNKDLALLWITGQASPLEIVPVGRSTNIESLQEVYTTGHLVEIQKDWLPTKGEVTQSGEFILYSATIGKGYSGGPLVNQQGELIGINIQVMGTSAAKAIPIDEVLNTIAPWMDLACVNEPTSVELTSVAGDWDSFFGKVTFKQTDDQVSGLLVYGDNTPVPGLTATIEGTLQGRKLVFSWWLTMDPNGKQNPQGFGELKLTPDGKTLDGEFTDRNNPGTKARWVLNRLASVAGDWESFFGKVTFKQTDDQVSGLLVYGDNTPVPGLTATIEGTLQGRKLVFSWWLTMDPNGKQNPQGFGELKLTPDGKTLDGEFTDRNNPGTKAKWVLTR